MTATERQILLFTATGRGTCSRAPRVSPEFHLAQPPTSRPPAILMATEKLILAFSGRRPVFGSSNGARQGFSPHSLGRMAINPCQRDMCRCSKRQKRDSYGGCRARVGKRPPLLS